LSASRVLHQGRTILPIAAGDFSNNVTLQQLGRLAIHLACCKKSTLQRRAEQERSETA
jgi:hypothetical protein